MLIYFTLILIFNLFCDQANAGKGKVKSGRMIGLNEAPIRENGRLKFKDSVSVSLEYEGVQSNIALAKRNPKVTSKSPSKPLAEVAVYLSSNEKVTCLHECNGPNVTICKARCGKRTDQGLVFFTGNKALLLPPNAGTEDLVFDPNLNRFNHKPTGSQKRSKRSTFEPNSKTKRSGPLVPDLSSDIGVIKLLMCPDKGFMDVDKEMTTEQCLKGCSLRKFLEFVGGDVAAARTEAELFLVLQTNEVARHLASLAYYNMTYTLLGVPHALDMTAFLQDILYPPENVAGTGFENTAWSAPYVVGDSIYAYVRKYEQADGSIVYDGDGVAFEFMQWMANVYSGPRDFDVAMALTGYDFTAQVWFYPFSGPGYIVDEWPFVFGFAWIGSLCRTPETYNSIIYDRTTTFVELFAPIMSTAMSHEIGHCMGAIHDDDTLTCPAIEYLMSATSYPANLDYPNLRKYSSCSAKQITDYLSSITALDYRECLFNGNPTQQEYLANYCQGVLGFVYGLHDYCKIRYGADAILCTGGNADLEAGYVPYDGCSQKSGTPIWPAQPLFACAPTSGANCINQYEVWAGTPCLNKSGTRGSKVCFNGICQQPQTVMQKCMSILRSGLSTQTTG